MPDTPLDNPQTPDTRVVDDPAAGRFDILVDGKPIGFASYQRSGAMISITHTEIDSSVGRRGYGSILVGGVLDAARAHGLSVLPLCPFVRWYIQRHPDYVDLVPGDQQVRFKLRPTPGGADRGAGGTGAAPA